MNTYLTIMVTVLAVCEAVRIIQNHINLRRQRIVFERECGHLSDFTDDDLKMQREAYRLIVENLTQRKVNNQIVPRSTKSDLKHCPLCGSEAESTFNTQYGWQVYCTNETCSMNFILMSGMDTEEEAIEAWNRWNRRAGNGN